METAIDRLPDAQRNDPEAIAAVVANAYRALFDGRGSQADANTVLLDLLQTSGWNEPLDGDPSVVQLAMQNGARRVVGRIFFNTGLPPERMQELNRALMRAPVLSQEDHDYVV